MPGKDRFVRRRSFAAGVLFTVLVLTTQTKPIAAQTSSAHDFLPSTSISSAAISDTSLVDLEGDLEVVVEDYRNFSRTRFFLRTPDARLRLHFAANPPTDLQSGAHVRVSGTRSGSTLMLSSASTGIQTLSAPSSKTSSAAASSSLAPLPNTFGAESTLVIMVNFQDAPTNQPYTVAAAQSAVFTTASNFFLENSYQQTWLTGAAVGWFTIPLSSTTCDTASIATYAKSAASAAGVNLAAYTHYVYAFPQNNACGWAGSSFIGGNPSQSWLNGALQPHIIDHELGHALGLYHAHLLDCGTTATIGSNCTINEYGDILDTMGAPQTASPHYNAFQKERLGWLNYGVSPSITTVQSAGTYTINAYELAGAGPSALKILKSTDPTTGAKTWYYVETRRPVGFDAFFASASSQNESNGVLVHIGTDGNGNSSDLLDMTPATPTYYWWFDPSLVVGQSFEDPASGLIMTTAWVTSTEAAVTVQFGGTAPLTGTVAFAVAASQSSYTRSQTVSLTATATAGGAPVANDSVRFTITKANGSIVIGTATTGTNGSAVYSMKLKRTDPLGTYQVNATTSINATSYSAPTTFSVQ